VLLADDAPLFYSLEKRMAHRGRRLEAVNITGNLVVAIEAMDRNQSKVISREEIAACKAFRLLQAHPS